MRTLLPIILAALPGLATAQTLLATNGPGSPNRSQFTGPMNMGWSQGGARWQWRPIESTFVDYVKISFDGGPEHAGMWVTPVSYVYFDFEWFQNPEVPNKYKHHALCPTTRAPGPSLSGNGWTSNPNSPLCYLNRSEVINTVDRLTTTPTSVYGACQPIFRVPSGSRTKRVWELDYSRWPQQSLARAFWNTTHRNPANNTVVTLEAWLKMRIWLQTEGQVNPHDLFADPIFQVHGANILHMNIQGIMLEGDERDPATFPESEPLPTAPPPPGLVGSSITMTLTSPLRYTYTGASGSRRDYAIGVEGFPTVPYVQNATVTPGQSFSFRAINLDNATLAVLEASNNPGLQFTVPVLPDPADLLGYRIEIPLGIPTGTQWSIASFFRGGIYSPEIPDAHRDRFTVQ